MSLARTKPVALPPEAVVLRAWGEAFGRAVILLDGPRATLASGDSALATCAEILGVPGDDAAATVAALARADPAAGAALRALAETGAACDVSARTAGGVVRGCGRSAGALAFLMLWREAAAPEAGPVDGGGEMRRLIETHPHAAFIADAGGAPTVVNRAWLEAAGAASLEDALSRGLAFDRAASDLAREALAAGAPLDRLRWLGSSGARRAFRLRAAPLGSEWAVVWSWDVTAAEAAAETLSRKDAALALILGEVADAVAIFAPDQRLVHHNAAFARLWGLEPAWLAEGPGHGAILDRLRQRRLFPETPDWGRFRAGELARHGRVDPAPEAIWRVGERILRVLSLPHPAGGLVLIFSDITTEVRLKSQFTHLLQVRQATLDKLNDAVSVFGADARLKLANDAFARLWAIPPDALAGEPTYDEVVERCVPTLHDMHFWTELKGRITDPDPGVRAAALGEARAADGRILAWQSRPLPDGATLVSFVDVTDARRLEGALRDREAALDAAERLKRDFVSSVSYELRTPLTTILGYAELLETAEASLSPRARRWVAAVRAAAADLARSVEDILAFAELDAGDASLDLAETGVAALVAEAAARWRVRAEEGGVSLEIALAEEPGAILADGGSLARVLDHLIDHALRQTAPGGGVTLSARRTAGEVCLEVADTGRGIPFHVQARIFDRFNGEEGAGAGLGLALVKALVEQHGGWVAVESEPGAGATFACHLPLAGQVPDEGSVLI